MKTKTEVRYSLTATSDYHSETVSLVINGFPGKHFSITLECFVKM